MAGLDRFKTVIRNTSGSTRFFAFLPPHGAELAHNQDFSYPGDLFAVLSGKGSRRDFDALAAEVNAGRIQVLQTPVAVRFDTAAGRVRQVNINAGSVAVADPEAGSYFGSAPSIT
jgi:hypothetical protein